MQQYRRHGAVFDAPIGCFRLHQPQPPNVVINCSQPRRSPLGFFILDDGVGLLAKRIEIIPSTTPQMLRISPESSAFSSYLRRIDEVHIIGHVVWFAGRL